MLGPDMVVLISHALLVGGSDLVMARFGTECAPAAAAPHVLY